MPFSDWRIITVHISTNILLKCNWLNSRLTSPRELVQLITSITVALLPPPQSSIQSTWNLFQVSQPDTDYVMSYAIKCCPCCVNEILSTTFKYLSLYKYARGITCSVRRTPSLMRVDQKQAERRFTERGNANMTHWVWNSQRTTLRWSLKNETTPADHRLNEWWVGWLVVSSALSPKARSVLIDRWEHKPYPVVP